MLYGGWGSKGLLILFFLRRKRSVTDEKQSTPGGSAPGTSADSMTALDEAVEQARQQEEVIAHSVIEEQDLPDSIRQVTVEIPREAWDARLEKLFKDWRREAAIEGFRPGKVPLKLLQRRFQKEAADDLVSKIAPPIIAEYEKARDLTLYGSPEVDPVVVEPDKPVRLVIRLEIKPVIEPNNYTGLTVEAPAHEVTGQMIESRLHMLQQENATYEEVDRAWEPGLALAVDMKIVDAKGRTEHQVADQLIERPENRLPSKVVSALTGKKAGDTVEVRTAVGSDQREVKSFTVTVRSVKELKVPSLDDEFAKDLGHESLAALKASLEAEEKKRADELNSEAAFDALMTKLAESHDFAVPPTLQARVAEDIARSDYRFMYFTGQRPRRAAGKSRQEYREQLQADARVRVKGFLLADAIARKENIEATEEDINAALEARAAEEGRKPLAIRAALEKERKFDQFVEQVRFDKLRHFLLSRNNIRYVTPPAAQAGDGAGDPPVAQA